MKTKEELLELSDFLEAKLTDFIQTIEFRKTAKESAKKNVHSILNIIIEFRHHLLLDGDPNGQPIIDGLELINKLYCKIYDSKDRLRRSIFNKENEK